MAKDFPVAEPLADASSENMANAIRALAMDAVQQANSGHPGAPMGMADIAVALWGRHLKHNPTNPHWFDRDRFVLSNGHGSMLIYALLHLTGYDLPIAELKNFRQLHSKTAGHPEVGITPGVETTTGPLGQGISNAVGMALAERTGGGFHAGRDADLGVARRLAVQLAEAPQLFDGQVVAGQVQQRVQQHRAVAIRHHEAVAPGPGGVGVVMAQVALPQRHRDLRHAHRHAGMPRFRRLHRIHRQRPNGVRELGVGRLGGDGGFHRKAQIILSA